MELLIVFSAAFFASFAGTPIMRRLALALGIVDRPGPRKIHREAVAYLGGVAFFFSLVAVVTLLAITSCEEEFAYWNEKYLILVAGALLVLLLGLYDDVRGASAWFKLPCQLAIGGIMYANGFRIDLLTNPLDFTGGTVNVASIGLVVTALWYVTLMNSVNLIDGMDGLAAGVVAIASASLLAIALTDGNTPVIVISIAVLGGTLGFLPFNFPPANIFMGDTGSLLLGYLLASAGLLGKTKGSTVVAMLIPLTAVGISLLDTFMAFLRRIAQGKHPFHPDQKHIHHRLLKLGLSQRSVVLIIYYCCVLFGLTSYVLSQIETQYGLLTAGVVLLGLFLGIKILWFIEDLMEKEDEAMKEPQRVSPGAPGIVERTPPSRSKETG